jgi:hypothetical protein
VKRYKIRKWSPIWWLVQIAMEVGTAVAAWGVVAGTLAIYSVRMGLPMPWEGLP